MKIRILLYLIFLFSHIQIHGNPRIILAQEFNGQDVVGWVMSEKLDGVRAYWDGKHLISRQGYIFNAPANFTKDFPNFPLDGELYSYRGQFEEISATVRRADSDWHKIKLHVFDVPNAKGNLYQRLQLVEQHIQRYPNTNLVLIKQIPIQNQRQIYTFLQQIESQDGEGVMLRNPHLPYQSGRSDGLLKLKTQHDAECVVTQHHEGKGKYQGKLGSLSCRNDLHEFKIGSGFTDYERSNPPAIGSTITYRYRGLTKKGLPRFPTYFRKKPEYEIIP